MIRVHAHFPSGVYSGVKAGNTPEWPPSPYRLFAALVAGAHAGDPEDTAAERDALHQLAALGPPVIWAPQHVTSAVTPGNWVPTTSLPSPGKGIGSDYLDTSLAVVGGSDTRKKYLLSTVRTALFPPDVYYDVDDDATPFSDKDLRHLDDAAHRVPYLGRSTHAVELSVSRVAADPAGPFTRLVPVRGVDTRTWSPDTLDQLDRDYAAVFVHRIPPTAQHERGRRLSYRPGRTVATVMTTIGLERARRTEEVPRIMAALHDAVQDQLTDPDAVLVLPLLNVGFPHSNGAFLGVGVVMGDSIAAERVIQVLAETEYFPDDPQEPSAVTLQGWRWTRESRRWASATPFVAHPDRRIAERQARAELAERYGVNADVEVDTRPSLTGARRWNLDHPEGGRAWWLTVSASTALNGPVVLGAATRLGFGVFAPQITEEAGRG